MHRTPSRLATSVLVAASIALAAAVAGPAAADAQATPTSTPKPQTITLVTHDSFAVSTDVLAAFTRRTGITVKVLQVGDAGQVVNQAILTKDNPLGDVLFGVDNTFLSRALDEGIFEPYRSPATDGVPAALQLDPTDRVTPVDYGDVCINYDKQWFADRKLAVPRSLEDLTKPAYKGDLVVEDPSTSSPGLAFLLATVQQFGVKGWQQYWKQLVANDVQVVDGWEQAYYDAFSGGGQGGKRPLVVSYASSPAAAVVFADPPITTSPIGTMTQSCFRQVEFAGVLKGTAHRAAARRFVDFMLSSQFQADVPLQMFVYPAVEGTALPKVFTQNADAAQSPYEMSPTRIGAQRDGWIRDWTGIVLR